MTLSYVGTEGHRLLSSRSANPGSPALCQQLAQQGAIAVGTSNTTCGPGNENLVYALPGGGFQPGTRLTFPGVNDPTLGPVVAIGNDSYFITSGQSSYNSAQVNYRHTSDRLQVLLAYTYSKAMDNSSGYGEQMNPIDPRKSIGLSAFDSTNNFTVSYNYSLPIDHWLPSNRLTRGWAISGITTFATGLPITLVETDDHSLLGTAFGGPIVLPVDTPDQVAPVKIMDPRTINPTTQGHYYFTAASFAPSAIGLEGNANRRFFHGPGINNWNMAFHKATPITERVNLEFRAELFNIFNHTQFIAPSSIGLCGGVTTCDQVPSFGAITQAAPPRIGQLSLKLSF